MTENLAEIREQMLACAKCKLRLGCAQVVVGEGPADALLAFFGEGPGADEDARGRPFVGRSGQLLRSTMERNRIPCKTVFIDNMVRCRPPENRDPNPDEIEACWPWTRLVLRAIRPKVIVTLGRPALMTIANKLGFKIKQTFSNQVGEPIYIEKRRLYVFPMFHPAYAARRNDIRREFNGHMSYLNEAIPYWLERP